MRAKKANTIQAVVSEQQESWRVRFLSHSRDLHDPVSRESETTTRYCSPSLAFLSSFPHQPSCLTSIPCFLPLLLTLRKGFTLYLTQLSCHGCRGCAGASSTIRAATTTRRLPGVPQQAAARRQQDDDHHTAALRAVPQPVVLLQRLPATRLEGVAASTRLS